VSEKETDKEHIGGDEYLVTLHRILESFGEESECLEILHRDLFDTREKVVCSSLGVLASLKNEKSVPYITKLLTQTSEKIQCAAIKALGSIGAADSKAHLYNLFKTTQSETVRCEIVWALSRYAQTEKDVITFIREAMRSQFMNPDSRAFCIGILLEIDDQFDVTDTLNSAGSDDRVLEEIFRSAQENPHVAAKVMLHAIESYHRLSVQNKVLLLSVAAPFTSQSACKILQMSITSTNPEIRRAAYKTIGKDPDQANVVDVIVQSLSDGIIETPSLEEEVILSIFRLEEHTIPRGIRVNSPLSKKIMGEMRELFDQMKNTRRNVMSDSHELGWLIVRSKEYIEYYTDEDLKQAIISYLKGSSNYGMTELLKRVKESAVKVEVRHFEGYKAVVEIVKNPKRPGAALIARELALAKLGKRERMYSLIRKIHLARLSNGMKDKAIYLKIYEWAKDAKLFRLSEAALYALSKVDIINTTSACITCLTPPIQSKILTIASLRLIKNLNWDLVEPSIVKLLNATTDKYLLLNLTDALSARQFPLSSKLLQGIINVITIERDQEVIARVCGLLGDKADYTILDNLIKIYPEVEDCKRLQILSVVEQLVIRNKVSSDLGLSEFLYRAVRKGSLKNKLRIAIILYRIGDDYAVKVLQSLVQNIEVNDKIEVVHGLHGALRPDIVEFLAGFLNERNVLLHQTLRETLLSAGDKEIQEKLVRVVLEQKGDVISKDSVEYYPEDEMSVDFSREKNRYRFEKDNLKKYTVFFTDIKDYSKKAQILTSMELNSLIQEYEGMLVSIITTHDGELIKRMGDGHLFVFSSPLNAVLAAIRVQKALRRFNSFREEKYRIMIRIGINIGEVVRRNNDVLGNTVNIASRLEKAAKSGSIYISRELNEHVKKYIHSRDIGFIKVKGIEQPLYVFEPFEMILDFPVHLDPLKRKRKKSVSKSSSNELKKSSGKADAPVIEKHLTECVRQSFITLNALCMKVEKGDADVSKVRTELSRCWRNILHILKQYGYPHMWKHENPKLNKEKENEPETRVYSRC
jgi:class 3 adenylate cyclase